MEVDALLAIQRASYEAASSVVRGSWPDERALGQNELRAFLDRNAFCVLATSRADGRPTAAPVAFVVHDGAFWFATAEGLRLRNLRVHPWVALVVTEGGRSTNTSGQAHVMLSAEGPVTLHEPDAWHSFAAEWLARNSDPSSWAAAIVELRPNRLFTHSSEPS
jgi:general stress protein 26